MPVNPKIIRRETYHIPAGKFEFTRFDSPDTAIRGDAGPLILHVTVTEPARDTAARELKRLRAQARGK